MACDDLENRSGLMKNKLCLSCLELFRLECITLVALLYVKKDISWEWHMNYSYLKPRMPFDLTVFLYRNVTYGYLRPLNSSVL